MRGERDMKKKTIYEDAPEGLGEAIEKSRRVKDFLPKPEDLVVRENTVRVTINLSRQSIEFFKKESKRLGVPYQKMIKNLIDMYAEKYGHI